MTPTDEIVARFRAALEDRETAARTWQRQAEELSRALQRVRAERDGLTRQVAVANEALASMVNQYMGYPEGFVTHEFMSAQEEAIDYLESIGWLKDGAMERYYWTDKSARAILAPAQPQPGIYCPATTDHECGRTDCIGAVCRMVEGAS